MAAQVPNLKTYFSVYVALMVLLVLTVGTSFINLGPFNVAASLAISLVKAGLIMLIFMEVRYSHPIVWLFSGAAFLWLVIMFALTLSDYFSRPGVQPDWRRGTNGVNHVEFATPPR